MKKSIAMTCNKEQFEAIKPKLKGMQIGCISNFNEWNYLVNNEDGYPFVICNTGESGSKRYNREIHETWSEHIFLKACGIETFEITKETIIKYKMKDEFPEVFKVKLEVGKWYKFLGNLCVHSGGTKTYGFWNEEFRNNISFGPFDFEDNDIVKATEQEVFEALKNEAVRRGFVGKDIYIKIGDRQYCLESEIGKFQLASNLFFYQGAKIFKNGTWAEIIPTKTKEEAEKLLNCKIID